MRKIIILVLVIFATSAISVLLNNKNQSETGSKNVSTQEVRVKLDKSHFKQDEPITFNIVNDTSTNVYYFPETCASTLAQVFLLLNDDIVHIQGDPKVCTLAPSLETLLPRKKISGKIPEKTLSKMTDGTYKLKFTYSLGKRDRFAVGKLETVNSENFTVE